MEKEINITPAITVAEQNILLKVHVSVRSSKSQIKGMHGDRLKVLLHAIPEDGAANAELIRLLADTLRIARKNIQLVSGVTSRDKTISLTEISLTELIARIKF